MTFRDFSENTDFSGIPFVFPKFGNSDPSQWYPDPYHEALPGIDRLCHGALPRVPRQCHSVHAGRVHRCTTGLSGYPRFTALPWDTVIPQTVTYPRLRVPSGTVINNPGIWQNCKTGPRKRANSLILDKTEKFREK